MQLTRHRRRGRPGRARPHRPYRQPRSRALPAIVAASAGLVTLASVFLPWYETRLGIPGDVGSSTGWEASGVGKVTVALAAIWMVAALAASADEFGSVRLHVRTIEGLGYLVVGCALLVALLVAFRIARAPGPDPDFLSRDIGLAIALAGAVLGVGAGFAMAGRR